MNFLRPVIVVLIFSFLNGCNSPEPILEPEVMSLLGRSLYAPELPKRELLRRCTKLNQAHQAYLVDPTNEVAIIWFGRRLAYLGRYHEAVDIFSEGLTQYPDSARLLRHRGHRYITLRRFEEAIADLSRAAELIAGTRDEIEPDGMPNAQGMPRSTTHTNIYYHLGLAYYLNDQFEESRQAYATCLDISPNDDNRVSSSYWLVLNLRRLGLETVAEALLQDINPDMDVIENFAYRDLLLMFKGELDLEAIEGVDGDALQNTTAAYGIAAWALVNGDQDEATSRYQAIVESDQWAAFGFIAAEAELARNHD
ncbi:MAG: tetratricopeptide repeat protein [Planctomycetota bacterium]|nr:tetratricopeptide repeat protein [Planctomycetota bacterium]